MELSKKDRELGKLKGIVREADGRLSELKENKFTQELLEKKQRVLSVENSKLKNSVKRAEVQLSERENLVESQNRQIRDINNNFKRLEEVKALEIEMLKNDIRQKDGHIADLSEDLAAVSASRDRLMEENGYLRSEKDQLKRMNEDSLRIIKELSQQQLKAYKSESTNKLQKAFPLIDSICKHQINDMKVLHSSNMHRTMTEKSDESFNGSKTSEKKPFLLDSIIKSSPDTFKKSADHRKSGYQIDLLESTRMKYNSEVLSDALEAAISENKTMNEKLECAERAIQDMKSQIGSMKDLLQPSEELKDSLTRLCNPLCTFIDEFNSDYSFIEKQLKSQSRDVLYQWRKLIESIKRIIEEEEFSKITSLSQCLSAGKNKSRQLSSYPSGPSLLDESIDQDRLFKEAEERCEADEAQQLPQSMQTTQRTSYQLVSILEEPSLQHDTFDLKVIKADGNFTFDMDQSHINLADNEHLDGQESDEIKTDMVLSSLDASNSKKNQDNKSFFDGYKEINTSDNNAKDKDKDDSFSNVSKLGNLSRSINMTRANPFHIVAELKNKSAKKDKAIKFLKDLVAKILTETTELSEKCLDFDADNFTENDLVDLDFHFTLPLDDARLQAMPGRITSNLDKLKFKQLKAFISGAKRMLKSFLTEDMLEISTANDKKYIYSTLKELDNFDLRQYLYFEQYLEKIDQMSDFMRHLVKKSNTKTHSLQDSSLGSEKSLQSNSSESIIREVFRLTTPHMSSQYDEDQVKIDQIIAELKVTLKNYISNGFKFKKSSSRHPIASIEQESWVEIIKFELQVFLRAIKQIHSTVASELSPDLNKLVVAFKRARQALKELLTFSDHYFSSEQDDFRLTRSLHDDSGLRTPLSICESGSIHPTAAFVALVADKEMALLSIRCKILQDKFAFNLQ